MLTWQLLKTIIKHKEPAPVCFSRIEKKKLSGRTQWDGILALNWKLSSHIHGITSFFYPFKVVSMNKKMVAHMKYLVTSPILCSWRFKNSHIYRSCNKRSANNNIFQKGQFSYFAAV